MGWRGQANLGERGRENFGEREKKPKTKEHAFLVWFK
jgi:hypothetical protein